MWKKVKVILGFLSSVLAVLSACLLFRHKTDGQSGKGNADGDTGIKEGTRRVEESIARGTAGIESSEGHLQRAEDILREAIKRSEEEEPAP